MLKKLKQFTAQMIAGANVATIIVMLLVGYSDRLYPVDHPMLSTVGMTFPVFLLLNMAFLLFWILFRWKMMWIPVVGFLLAYVPISIYIPLNASKEVPDGAIKLISYNICAYGGNYKYDDAVDKVQGYLVGEKADIACLQEDVDGKRHRDNLFKMYEEKGFTYNDTVVICNSATSFNALGIHTRFPILKRERIDYPSKANGSVAWWLNVDGDTLIVINNHFESGHLNKNDREQYKQILKGKMPRDSVRSESEVLLIKLAEANAKRASQIDCVKRYVEEHSQYAVIVCGDFNNNPISYSRHHMAEGLTDAFVTTGWGLGLSYNQKAFRFRIDHLFCSETIDPYNCKIDAEMDASDHNPLLCWLKIKPKR